MSSLISVIIPVYNGRRYLDAALASVQAALGLDSVIRALDGKPVKKIVVVPKRIVNVVG